MLALESFSNLPIECFLEHGVQRHCASQLHTHVQRKNQAAVDESNPPEKMQAWHPITGTGRPNRAAMSQQQQQQPVLTGSASRVLGAWRKIKPFRHEKRALP